MGTRKILQVFLQLFIGVSLFNDISAQESFLPFSIEEKKLIVAESNRYKKLIQPGAPSSVASIWFDAVYYQLNLKITAIPEYIRGRVLIKGICGTDSANILTLDLSTPMFIDSIIMDGGVVSFTRDPSSFTVTLDRMYIGGEEIMLQIFYQGRPTSTGFGSFQFGSHGGVPWIWSLSQPYGAKDWWPCKDNPSDKADSADIVVTCDSMLKVGSNGILTSVTNNGDGTCTHFWKERYPIATYLVSVSITNFEQFSNWFHYSPADSMEILNYVLPEHLILAKASLPKTVGMLEIFSDIFGPYPFIKEKYGHADFGWGGAMEHQTMTSTTTYNEGVIAHELAHQWFGDMITCRTWPHLWLNEGFAQYGTGLYYEREYGVPAYRNYILQQMANAKFGNGSLYVADTANISHLFDGAMVYSKGASVLHMLRHVLGDSLFFAALRAYAIEPGLQYGSAITEDFQSVCERISGTSLDYFFSEWIYGEKYPRYDWYWAATDSAGFTIVTVSIDQSTETANPLFFTMPVDIRVSHSGVDTIITLFNNQQYQIFSFTLPYQPNSLTLDPDNWILKEVHYLTHREEEKGERPLNFSLDQNFPNPFNPSTTIHYTIPMASKVTITIIDLLGREVEVISDEFQQAGHKLVEWIPTEISGGVYFCKMKAVSLSYPQTMFVDAKKDTSY